MAEPRVLESWKEISDYLGRSIKTCQRWEAELGLPIHRLDGTPSARVFGYSDELDSWMAEKLNHPEAEGEESSLAEPGKKKWPLIAASAFAVLAAGAVLIWQLFLLKPVVFPYSGFPSIAFFPFENITREESLEAWRQTLPQLFTIDLLQSRTVAVEYSALPGMILKKLKLSEAQKFTADEVKKIGEHIRKDFMATGSLIKSEKDIIVNLSLYDSKSGEMIHSFRKICRDEKQIFSAVDALTREIKLAMRIPTRLVSHDIDEDVGRIVTDSPEAVKIYGQGMALLMTAQTREAIPFFLKATELDPGFAEAFYHLFFHYRAQAPFEGTSSRDDAIRYGKKVIQFSDRLNVWTWGQFIERYYLRFQKDLAKAIAEWKKLLAIRENDPVVMLQLALIYSNLEEDGKVIALLENESAKQDSRNIRLLANAYARKGAYTDAERVFNDFINKDKSRDRLCLYERRSLALNQKKFEEALSLNDRMLAQRSEISVRTGRAPIFISQDDFQNAESELRQVIEQGAIREKFAGYRNLAGLCLTQGKLNAAKEQAHLAAEAANTFYDWRARKSSHYLMAYLECLSGNLEKALEEAEQACPCYEADDLIVDEKNKRKVANENDDIECLKYFHLRALINLEMGRMEEFERRVEEIKKLLDKGQLPKLIRAYYHLLGLKELRGKNVDKAIDYFWKTLNQFPSSYENAVDTDLVRYYDIDSAHYYYSLAETYYQAGRYWTALELYEKVAPNWEQRIMSGDIYARKFYRIAKIYDQGRRPLGTPEDQLKADKAQAVENYRKFLSLWKDADPIFAADVENAKTRLAVLEAEQAPAEARSIEK